MVIARIAVSGTIIVINAAPSVREAAIDGFLTFRLIRLYVGANINAKMTETIITVM
jgi:hypothetical protein